MARYIENLTECTDPVSGDYLWIVDASAGSTDKDRKVDIAKFGMVSATTTWTPALAFGGASTGITYSMQVGRCVRIGNIVALYVGIALSSKGSATGNATISGLPFTPGYVAMLACRWNYMASSLVNVSGYVQTSTIAVLGITAAATNLNSITDAAFANNSELIMTGVYLV